MNVLDRDKQIAVIAALCDGLGIRATARITGVNRGTVAGLALRVGQGCARLHDQMMVRLRVSRIEIDETWSYVGKKQRRVAPTDDRALVGDQYVFIAIASSSKAILSYRVGKRDYENTSALVYDLRDRVLGAPEISTDAWPHYEAVIRGAFGSRVAYGQIKKTVAVTDLRRAAAHRYSPAEVVAVTRRAVIGTPKHISTSYVERGNLSLRMGSRRFTRLTNGFSKKLEAHAAAVSLYVAHFNFCRVHEALRAAPAVTLGVTDQVWTIGDLLDAALAFEPTEPSAPIEPAPARQPRFRVVQGGKS